VTLTAVTTPCPAQTPPPNPAAAASDGWRVLPRGGVAGHVVTPQAPWTGSGCREHSYGASELATNAILHSRSGHPARTFVVRAALYPGDYAWVEVTDRGGRWTADEHDDEHGRGLAIVAAIAGDGNWGIGGAASRTTWFRLNWLQGPTERDMRTSTRIA
jgi:hypothetical protein